MDINANLQNLDYYPDQLVITSRAGNILTISGNHFPEFNFINNNLFSDHFPEQLKTKAQSALEKCLIGKQLFTFECELNNKNFELRIMPQPETILIIIRDISAQIIAEKIIKTHYLELIESSKQAALRHMAGGIAHEINNPLAIVLGKAEAIVDQAENNELTTTEIKATVNIIVQMVKRISHVINALRNFARDFDNEEIYKKRTTDIINAVLALCGERFKNYGVAIDVINASPEIILECRPNQIEQALLNLLINSFEAIKKLTNRWIKIETLEIGEIIKIIITDSGTGIDPKIANLIMQPFFTTKDIGKGIGTGLNITKGIIESHGGELSLNNTSVNTCFEILLPKIQRKK